MGGEPYALCAFCGRPFSLSTGTGHPVTLEVDLDAEVERLQQELGAVEARRRRAYARVLPPQYVAISVALATAAIWFWVLYVAEGTLWYVLLTLAVVCTATTWMLHSRWQQAEDALWAESEAQLRPLHDRLASLYRARSAQRAGLGPEREEEAGAAGLAEEPSDLELRRE
jgi:hypothetical protein